MEDRIIEKLNNLSKELPFEKESQVVYFFVETRKLIDRVKQKEDYLYIKFFCDWILHTEKTRNLDVVRDDFENIASDFEFEEGKTIGELIRSGREYEINKFVRLRKLREQITKFLNNNRILDIFTTNDHNWCALRNLLFRVLAEQKIDFGTRPIRSIKSLCFTEVREDLYGSLLLVECIKNGKLIKRPFIFADDHSDFEI